MSKNSRKSIFIFFIVVTAGLLLLSGLMLFSSSSDIGIPAYFSMTTMLLPAAGVMAGKLSIDRKSTPARKYYLLYLSILTILIVAITSGVFLRINISIISSVLIIAASLAGYYFLSSMSENERTEAGLNLSINKKMMLNILLFVLLFAIMIRLHFVIHFLATGDKSVLLAPVGQWQILPGILVNFFISYIPFFGEEYGWRYFLQKVLVEKFGKRTGILFVGVIWSFYHIPIDFIANHLPLSQFPLRLVVCVSLAFFLGWVYENTQSIWAVAFIHFLNNNLYRLWEMTQSTCSLSALSYAVVFLPFVFAGSLKTKKDTPRQ